MDPLDSPNRGMSNIASVEVSAGVVDKVVHLLGQNPWPWVVALLIITFFLYMFFKDKEILMEGPKLHLQPRKKINGNNDS